MKYCWEDEPVTHPVYCWLEIAYELYTRGDGALAEAIHRAMDGRQLSDSVAFKWACSPSL